MSDKDLFWYWINERHRIALKKMGGESPPFTLDPILQEFKFTNVFRELDRTTKWFDHNIRSRKHGADLLWWTCLFRSLGTIQAGQELLFADSVPGSMVTIFDEELLGSHLVAQQAAGLRLFTGAYMITCQYPGAKGKPKVISLFKHCLSHIYRDREKLYDYFIETQSLEKAVTRLMSYNGFGGNGFMAYEVVSDLRHTPVLCNAVDIHTWANPGPGAQRGLSRYHGRYDPATKNKQIAPRSQTVREMRELLELSPQFLESHVPTLEMRDIEHSLCEWDKYMRVKTKEGRPRSKYVATPIY